MAEHTPGPWEIVRTLDKVIVLHHPIGDVAIVESHSMPEEETDANARLIAAAPELLAALQDAPKPESEDAIAWIHAYSRWWHKERAKAIAKAKGGAA